LRWRFIKAREHETHEHAEACADYGGQHIRRENQIRNETRENAGERADGQ